MSDCMTLDVFAAEEKYPSEELKSSKDIVQSILNETLHSVVGNSEKVLDSNHIGDCNIAEEFLQYIPLNPSESANRKFNEASEEENNQQGEKPKEHKVIQEKALTNCELRIQNGKIHLQANGSEKACCNTIREETCSVNKKQDHINDVNDSTGKRELLRQNMLLKLGEHSKDLEVNEESRDERADDTQGIGKPFTPLTTEDLRQSILKVWKNVNSPVINGLGADLSNQPQEVVRLVEELPTLVNIPDITVDPNRPRACTLVEEDVKKMIKEIGEMNFNTNATSLERSETHNGNSHGIENSDENDENRQKERNIIQEDTSNSTQRGSLREREEDQHEQTLRFPENTSVLYAMSGPEFKSQKFNDSYDLEGNGAMFTMSLTESDEVYVEASESVIQIIEPKDDSNDESEDKIVFSLLNESDRCYYQKDEDFTLEYYDQLKYGSKESFRLEDIQEIPKVRSGMTTVGPVRSMNYDPKVLTETEIDYGKMTKISGSREMKKDSATDTFGSTDSKKIYIDDNDDNPVIFFENGYMEFDTIVNHDIASMTKVQKVKEVLSDQPKSDEDLKGEEKLLRSPLDLKDVDAYSCESYDIIDIGVPLLTIGETNSNSSKELDQNADVPSDRDNNILDNIQNMTKEQDQRNGCSSGTASEEGKIVLDDSRSDLEKEQEYKEIRVQKNTEKRVKSDDRHQISSGLNYNKSLTQVNVSQSQKHNTISRVFQKTSNRFIMKDSDSFLRNSKSLPRDTSKITNTESFKSLLDDCQTSAATVLKKSRSLLRNTQNVLKAVSKTGFGHTTSGDKQVYTTSDVAVEQKESRQSTSFKNNGFLKFKDTIINKVGKTLKSLENLTSEDAKGIGNDRYSSENLKKPPPKSPLVCRNQLPQSCEEKEIEYQVSGTTLGMSDPEEAPQNADTLSGVSEESEIEVICGVKFQGNSRFTSQGPQSDFVTHHFNDPDQIDYVIMDTVQGLKDDEIPDSVEINRTVDVNGRLSQINPGSATKSIQNREMPSTVDILKSSTDNGKSLTMPYDRSLQEESLEELAGKEGNGVRKSISNEKLRRKNKKLSARIRSFWQTAFGKVKATSPKKDVS